MRIFPDSLMLITDSKQRLISNFIIFERKKRNIFSQCTMTYISLQIDSFQFYSQALYIQNMYPSFYRNPQATYGIHSNLGTSYAMRLQAVGAGFNSDPHLFYFTGNCLSLQSRFEAMKDEQIEQKVDATISVVGMERQKINMLSLLCTIVWGSILLIPLLLCCCNWWKKCTFPLFEIPTSTYRSLSKLTKSPTFKNLTLTVMDNNFNAEKASILYNILSQSNLIGFTFINKAQQIDLNQNEYSNFSSNMAPIKELTRITSQIRWRSYPL